MTPLRIGPISDWIHHRLIAFLIAAYALAAFAPGFGLRIRSGEVSGSFPGEPNFAVSFPTILLALLLFNAGLGVEPTRLKGLFRRSRMLCVGLAANLLIPLGFILAVSVGMSLWHNSGEVQSILVGLALIASMPVAGSSTAWSQNTDGDMALSIGLVLGSTLLSPLTTPAILHSVGWVAEGDFSTRLHELAAGGTSRFLLVCVLLPSVAGIATRCFIGPVCHARFRPALKLINSIALLILCYSNAAVALPGTVANPDWDFLGVMLAIVLGLCVLGFAAGGAIARCSGADPGQRASLMFGLGMTNNGTGLVLAATSLLQVPDVMLPVIFYNLIQHLVAGAAARWVLSDANAQPGAIAAGAS